jgi:hypothetical protein
MKKLNLIVLAMVFTLMLTLTVAFAQAPVISKTAVVQPKGLGTLGGVLGESLPFQLNGDSLYQIRSGTFAGGVGVDVASWKGILTFRGEMAQGVEGSPFMGAGIFVNIPTLLNTIAGVNWQAGAINPSVGIVPGYDFTNSRFDAAIVLSIISVTF